MDRGSTERLPRETPAPEDYYELTNSQPPAACVGCQAWSKAQDSGSCPVGVRRFKSCPTHPSRLDSDQKLQAIRFRRCAGNGPWIVFRHRGGGDLVDKNQERA